MTCKVTQKYFETTDGRRQMCFNLIIRNYVEHNRVGHFCQFFFHKLAKTIRFSKGFRKQTLSNKHEMLAKKSNCFVFR